MRLSMSFTDMLPRRLFQGGKWGETRNRFKYPTKIYSVVTVDEIIISQSKISCRHLKNCEIIAIINIKISN